MDRFWSKVNKSNGCKEIRSLRGLVAQKELAKRFGVNQGQISAIQLNKFWSHV